MMEQHIFVEMEILDIFLISYQMHSIKINTTISFFDALFNTLKIIERI